MSSTSSCQKFFNNFHKFTADYNKEILVKVLELVTLGDEDIVKLTEFFNTLSSKTATNSIKGAGVPKKKRAPTEYNLFMKKMITELRQEHPEIDKKKLMSMGAEEWQKQKAAKAAAVANESPVPPTPTPPVVKSKK